MKTLTFCLGDLRTNTYFCFEEDGECVVIDPGMDALGILDKLKQKGLIASHILLTHGHFDHSLAAKLLAEKTGAKICIHEADEELLLDPWKNSAAFFYRGKTEGYPVTHADVLLREGDVLTVGSMNFEVMHTPGHTNGSCVFRQKNTLFCGDTVFAYGFGRYDLYGGDRALLSASLRRIAALEDNYKICPGHGNSATLERIRAQILQDAKDLCQ